MFKCLFGYYIIIHITLGNKTQLIQVQLGLLREREIRQIRLEVEWHSLYGVKTRNKL